MLRYICAGLLGAVLGPVQALAEAACREDTVLVRGDWGQARFRVEVAETPDERAKGLMGRDSMPSGAGMLFVFQKTGQVSFWMENTLIPLDMLFLDENGRIVRIHHKAVPLDRTPIPGGENVRYVLEINGGLSTLMGITKGSFLRHPSILQEGAVWPCEGGS